MAKNKRRTTAFHGLPKWKMTIILSVSLLRLRFLPTIPFSQMAKHLQAAWPESISRFAAKKTPGMLKERRGVEEDWLPKALEEMFAESERKQTCLWQMARDLEEWAVWQFGIVNMNGSGSEVFMYGMLSREEVGLQIRWRAEGDWKAGSIPMLESDANLELIRDVGVIGDRRRESRSDLILFEHLA